jgi:hypothetical protein
LYGPGAAFRGGKRLRRRTTLPVMKLCVDGLRSCNCLIVKISVGVTQTAEAGVFSHRGSLRLDFGDLDLDQIANGDETDQPVSLHHGRVAEPARRHISH